MKDKFVKSAFVLMFGGVVAKLFSVIYRIGLTRILGGVGIGIYQLVFPVYSLGVVLTTTGIPMAISKVVAKNKGNEKCVVKKCLLMVSILSIILTVLLVVFSEVLANLQGNKDLYVCYMILAPTFIILGCSSVLRGYFQGVGSFVPSAMSSIAEQFAKLVFGLSVSLVLLKFGLIVSVVGAICSIVISEIVSMSILAVCYFRGKNKCKNNVRVSSREILSDAVPIILTNIILPFATFIDSLIVVKLLMQNFSYSASVYLYGLETGAVSSFTSLPTIFSFALASVVLPIMIREEKKDNKLNATLKLTAVITLPICLAFAVIPRPLIEFLYGERLYSFGFDGVTIAARLLTLSSIGIFFLSISQILSSSMQANGLRYSAIKNMAVGAFIKFVIEIILISNKNINIYALAIANTTFYFVICVMNYLDIKKTIKIHLDIEYIIKLIAINAINCLFIIIYFNMHQSLVFTVIGGFLFVFIYILLIYVFNLFNFKNKNKYL